MFFGRIVLNTLVLDIHVVIFILLAYDHKYAAQSLHKEIKTDCTPVTILWLNISVFVQPIYFLCAFNFLQHTLKFWRWDYLPLGMHNLRCPCEGRGCLCLKASFRYFCAEALCRYKAHQYEFIEKQKEYVFILEKNPNRVIYSYFWN